MAIPSGNDLALLINWCNAFLALESTLPQFYRSAKPIPGQSLPNGSLISSQFAANSFWINQVLSLLPSQRQNRRRNATFSSRKRWQSDYFSVMAQANTISAILIKNNLITAPAFAEFLAAINDIYIKSIQPYV